MIAFFCSADNFFLPNGLFELRTFFDCVEIGKLAPSFSNTRGHFGLSKWLKNATGGIVD